MATSGTQFRNKITSDAKRFVKGLLGIRETGDFLPDSNEFVICTGTTALPDISATAGTTVLLTTAEVPAGCKCYITSIEVDVTGSTAWSGGTGTTKSITFQDTAGTEICAFTQASLTGNTFYVLPVGGTLATGVTDALIRAMGASTAVNQGIQVVVANSTAGSAVRVRIYGYFAL